MGLPMSRSERAPGISARPLLRGVAGALFVSEQDTPGPDQDQHKRQEDAVDQHGHHPIAGREGSPEEQHAAADEETADDEIDGDVGAQVGFLFLFLAGSLHQAGDVFLNLFGTLPGMLGAWVRAGRFAFFGLLFRFLRFEFDGFAVFPVYGTRNLVKGGSAQGTVALGAANEAAGERIRRLQFHFTMRAANGEHGATFRALGH